MKRSSSNMEILLRKEKLFYCWFFLNTATWQEVHFWMQNHKKWGKNQQEQEETGLFPHFLQVGRLGKAKKIVYFLSNKKYEKTNDQYFVCKKTGKHQSLEATVRECSKEIKKGEFLKRTGRKAKKNRTDERMESISCLFCCQGMKLLSFLQC